MVPDPPQPTPDPGVPSGLPSESRSLAPSTPRERAEELLARRIAALPSGEIPDLASLVGQAPELQQELESMHADWVWLEGQLQDNAEVLGPGIAPEVLVGRYRLREELGRGGMGLVFRAWDSLLHRQVALKIAREATAGSAQARARFLDEAQITSQLEHPGIVPVHEVGVHPGGYPWFTMSLVHGEDLRSVYESLRQSPTPGGRTRILRALVSVAETLAFAHDRGVLHRDLKPSNVMVGPFGQVYVMDWGLSRVRSAPSGAAPVVERPEALATLAGAVLGTPAYMAPEQARGEVCTSASDVYSMGAMMYELLSGGPPYREVISSGGSRAVVEAVRSGPPRSLRQLAPAGTEELCSIAERAMARSAEARYASAADLAEDLRANLEQRVVSAHRRRPWTPLGKWYRRNRGLAAALAVGALTLGAAVLREAQGRRVLEDKNSDLAAAKGQADQALEDAEQASYVALIAAAQAKLELGQGDLAREDLQRCPLARRGWEWSYLHARLASGSPLLQLGGEVARRNSVAISDDQRWVARLDYGDLHTGFHLHDLQAGTQVAVPSVRGSHAFGVVFRPEGDELLTVDTWGWLARWSVEAEPRLLQKAVVRSRGGFGQRAFAWDFAGERVAVVMSNNHVQVFHARTLERQSTFELPRNERLTSLAFRPGHPELFLGTEGYEVLRLDLNESRVLARRTLAVPARVASRASLAVSPGGELLAVGLPSGDVELCEPQDLGMLRRLPISESAVLDVSFGPTREQVICASVTSSPEIWSTSTGRQIGTLETSSGALSHAEWRPGWSGPVTVHEEGAVIAWRRQQAGQLEWDLGGNLPTAATVDPERKRLYAVQSDGVPLVFGLERGEVLGSLPVFRGVLQELSLTAPGGDLLCRYWAESEELVLRDGDGLGILGRRALPGTDWRMDIDGVGRHVLSVSPGLVQVDALPALATAWELRCAEGELGAACFDLDPASVLVGFANGRLERRSLEGDSPTQATSLPLERLSALSVSRSTGRIAVAGKHRVLVLDGQSLAVLATIDAQLDPKVRLSFSPDGGRLAVGKLDPLISQGVMEVFDPGTGQRLATLGRADRSLFDAHFLPGSSLALARTFRGSVLLFSDDPALGIGFESHALALEAEALVAERRERWPMSAVLAHSLAQDPDLSTPLRTAAVTRALHQPTDLDAVEARLRRFSDGHPQLFTDPDLCLGMVELFNLTVGIHRAGPYLAAIHASQGRPLYARGCLQSWTERADPTPEERAAWLDKIDLLEELAIDQDQGPN